MKLYFLLLLALATAVMGGTKLRSTCEKKPTASLVGFFIQPVNVNVPCKFVAVNQRCGKYDVRVTPGQEYFANKYQVSTIWLGIREFANKQNSWIGRTTNKVALKVLAGNKSDLFFQKGGNLKTEDIFTFGMDDEKKVTFAKTDEFKLTFRPWHPDSGPKKTTWSFTCETPNTDLSNITAFPQQLCAYRHETRTNNNPVDNSIGNLTDVQSIYYSIFNNAYGVNITQTDPMCMEATDVFSNVCPNNTMRIETMAHCAQILSENKQRKCTTKFSCGPMQTFLECLKWGCSGFQDMNACEELASSIDDCRNFRQNGLSQKVKDANCYKDFYP